MSRITQEFYCGNCNGYFLVKLNMSLTMGVQIHCPNCDHLHHRFIKEGRIYERGRDSHSPVDEIIVTKASYSKKPRSEAMRQAANSRRDGVPLTERDPVSAQMIQDIWIERFGGR